MCYSFPNILQMCFSVSVFIWFFFLVTCFCLIGVSFCWEMWTGVCLLNLNFSLISVSVFSCFGFLYLFLFFFIWEIFCWNSIIFPNSFEMVLWIFEWVFQVKCFSDLIYRVSLKMIKKCSVLMYRCFIHLACIICRFFLQLFILFTSLAWLLIVIHILAHYSEYFYFTYVCIFFGSFILWVGTCSAIWTSTIYLCRLLRILYRLNCLIIRRLYGWNTFFWHINKVLCIYVLRVTGTNCTSLSL